MKRWIAPVMLALLLAAQLAFWHSTRDVRPALDAVPTPPSQAVVDAFTLGDREAYFRLLALRLQNFGDWFSSNTPLRYYDYTKLYVWLRLLDTLNPRSDMLPNLAAYYYAQTPYNSDVRYMASYLYEHGTRSVGTKWWWLLQCMYLAMYKLHDMDFAQAAVNPMLNPAVPVWAQQMVAVVHEQRGEMEDAYRIIESIQHNAKNLSDADLRYMRYFVEERLHALENKTKKH